MKHNKNERNRGSTSGAENFNTALSIIGKLDKKFSE